MKKNRIILVIFVMIIIIGLGVIILKANLRTSSVNQELPALPANTQPTSDQLKADLDYLTSVNQELPALPANTQFTSDQLKADLDYLTETLLKTHPKTINGFNDSQKKAIEQAYKQITSHIALSDFFFIVNSIICTFNDPHTSLKDVVKDSTAIQAYFKWFNEGFYSVMNCGELHKGDKLISVGGIETKILLEKLGEVIPHENEFWLYTMSRSKLALTQYLRYAGVDTLKKSIGAIIEREGVPIEVEIPVITDEEWENGNPQENYVSCEYKIDTAHNLGYLRIDNCTDNAAYQSSLKSLFGDVSKQKISNLVVDLRNNTGGNSWVANRFIQYLDVAQYNDFSSYIRFSPLAKKRLGYPSDSGEKIYKQEITKNQIVTDKSLLFRKKVYILTSHVTFSSANMFAVYFKDNNLGTIIGEETGNSPSACGDIIMAQLPNSHISFNISHKIFNRPDISKDNDNTLYPDIVVRTTIDDWMSKRDPVMQQVYKLTDINN